MYPSQVQILYLDSLENSLNQEQQNSTLKLIIKKIFDSECSQNDRFQKTQ